MKTNYNNLSPFEASIVVVAIIGLALIGLEIFMTLPHTQQRAVSNAFSMFDMHKQFSQAGQTFAFANDSMQEFYRQFDIAFNQTFSYPDQIGQPVLKVAKAMGDYSTFVAGNYNRNLAVTQRYSPGETLGAMIIKLKAGGPGTVSSASIRETRTIHKDYYYHEPSTVQKLFEQK